jgi:GPH family glycoside/pentoside/hexuronide:cation symporter
MADPTGGGLTRREKLGYGIGDLGGNMFFTIIAFWLLGFFVDVLGLGAALAGTAILLGRAWDAVSDPVMGVVSDRTRTPFGRRRPYLLFGGILLIAAMVVLFLDVRRLAWSQNGLFLWATLSFAFASTVYTVVFVPYGALTADLARTYNERTSLTGYRMAFAIVGTLVGAGLFPIVVELLGGGGYTLAAAVFGALMTVTILLTFASVRERGPVAGTEAQASGVLRSYLRAMRFRPFLLALAPWTLHMTGIVIITSSVGFYFQHIHGRADLAPLASGALLIAAFIGVVFWVRRGRRASKSASYSIGMGIFGAALLLVFFVGHLDVAVLFILLVVAGFGLATNYVMPWSILPDVIDAAQLESGVREEGLFYGLFTFWQKLGLGLAGFVAGLVLNATGYVAGGDAVQTELAQLGIRLLIGPIPAVLFLAGILIMIRYPIDRARHAQIVELLESRGDPA